MKTMREKKKLLQLKSNPTLMREELQATCNGTHINIVVPTTVQHEAVGFFAMVQQSPRKTLSKFADGHCMSRLRLG